MVNDLRALMHENVAAPPPDQLDLAEVLTAGRRRVRSRRRGTVGLAALATAAAVSATVLLLPQGDADPIGAASRPPAPGAPTIQLADAGPAVEGEDYRVLASHTNDNLDQANGQYFDGVTGDGLVLFRDGARDANDWTERLALMDPATGEKDWLPGASFGQRQVWPVELSSERLVLLGGDGPADRRLTAFVFDRASRAWSTVSWPDLPPVDYPSGELGPDGRLYVPTPATQGAIPEGGWPRQPGGQDAEDADAEGDTFHLWSVSLDDPGDVRAELQSMGDVAFTEREMVWTDSTNGAAGLVHVRDLATGAERAFDPQSGERCNLLSFGASGDRIVMSQYCGTYDGGVRDDRVQILTTDGAQVATIQDSGISGWIPTPGSELVSITAHTGSGGDGTYVYELDEDRLVRLSDAVGNFSTGGGPTLPDQLMWTTPVNDRHGATQWLAEWVG